MGRMYMNWAELYPGRKSQTESLQGREGSDGVRMGVSRNRSDNCTSLGKGIKCPYVFHQNKSEMYE